MVRALTALAVTSLLVTVAAFAAGPFDGQWQGHTVFGQRRCTGGDFPVTVTDNKVSGEWKGIYGTYPVSGTIAPDGTFHGTLGKGSLTGKFSGDKFEGSFPPPNDRCGSGTAQFERSK